MSEVRRLAGAVVAIIGLGTVAFGAIRGLASTGPAKGVRLIVDIAPPVDAAVAALAQHVATDRLEEKGQDTRVMLAGDHLIVELGETDPQIIDEEVALLERTAKVEVHVLDDANPWMQDISRGAETDPAASRAGIRVVYGVLTADGQEQELSVAEADAIGCTGQVEAGKRHCLVRGDRVLASYIRERQASKPKGDRIAAYGALDGRSWRPYVLAPEVLLDGHAIHHAEVVAQGVALEVTDASRIKPGVPLAFVLDGIVHGVATADRAVGTELHVVLSGGATGDVAFKHAEELVSVLDAGAVHPLHVSGRETFTRATGFWPRAWLFFAIGGVLLLAGAFAALRSTSSAS